MLPKCQIRREKKIKDNKELKKKSKPKKKKNKSKG